METGVAAWAGAHACAPARPRPPCPPQLAVLSDGRLAGGSSDGSVRVWDPAAPAPPLTLALQAAAGAAGVWPPAAAAAAAAAASTAQPV